jgi:serine-type D-Ala-D-Ala carboxypeptidase/endopeptidase (penicillin-binding protein 4)
MHLPNLYFSAMYKCIQQTVLGFVLILSLSVQAQTVSSRLQEAYAAFANDPQLSNALSSLYVVNAKTGAVVFDQNSRIGLAPASTQKVITAATAYALLGKDFRYKTEFGIQGSSEHMDSAGFFYITPSYDPTLGSWRWPGTKDSFLVQQWSNAAKALARKKYMQFMVLDSGWQEQKIPDGWIWQDIGNYYGAGAGAFNWRENQFDIVMKSGKEIGSAVEITALQPALPGIQLMCFVKAAARGSGDNAYVYFSPASSFGVIHGTIPVEENEFRISAALPNPSRSFESLMESIINPGRKKTEGRQRYVEGRKKTMLYTHLSPTLDSINYWFQKRSINLYGEALIKTIGYQKEGIGTTEKGVAILKNFWKEQGLAPTELNMVDGSGLSPLNRVTTHAQVEVLRFAKNQNWFAGYYDALPLYNDMKMKSGTINGAKGFCGYHRSKDGTEYIFSFLVNNYNGSASALVRKMYAVLDVLK